MMPTAVNESGAPASGLPTAREGRPVPVLMLASDEPLALGGPSGYTPIARYTPGARLLQATRRAAPNLPARLADAAAARVGLSRWYRRSSARLEWQGWREIRRGFRGVVHTLWGERDLGFLDLVPRTRHRLCCTFHPCSDTFAEVFPRPGRLRSLDAIILTSESQRPFFEAARVPAERIHIIHLGVDTKLFRPASAPTDRPFVVLSVGNYRRRFDLLREVARQLRSVAGVRFVVVAPPGIAPFFAAEPNVTVRSGLSTGELVATYQTAGCLLMTLENAAANGAILEGMACGLPVVAEAIGGVPEYVTAGCGVLTEPGRAVRLAEAIVELARNERARENMCQTARRRAEELDWSRVAARTVLVYEQLLSGK